MLLQELKILREVDRTPLEQSLNMLGVNLGRRDRDEGETGDVPPSLAPFVRQYILTAKPAKMAESDIKRELDRVQVKADSPEQKYESIFKSLAGMRNIIRRLQNTFEDEIRQFPELDQLARGDKDAAAKTGDAWLQHWRNHANQTADSNINVIAKMIDQGKDSLDDAVMKVTAAETWAQKQAAIFKKHLQAMKASKIDEEFARQEVRLTYAVFHVLEQNLTHVLQMIEPLKKPKA